MSRSDRKLATRREILTAARALFSESGWEGTTTREVAGRAGVAIGTVFLHFPDKSALLEAALREQIAEVLGEAWRTLPDGGVLEELCHLAGALYGMYARDPALSRVLVKESLFLVDGQAATESRAQLAAFVAGVAERLQRGGVADPQLGAITFFSLYFSVLVMGLREGLPVPAQVQILRSLLAQFFKPGVSS